MDRGGENGGPLGAEGPTGPGEPSVRLDRVSKHFGDLVAVRELELDIGRGEFFTMLGPSGCGKTTTLRIVAGFERPTAGRVLIDGADVAALPSHRRPTNTVFQSYALFPHLSVRDNVAFGLRRKKVPKGEVAQRVEAELERVGLAAEINRRPNQLSGGQQQRVALARALVNLPKVLLLDEPLGALDLKLRKGLQVELKRIQREVGITFVYVTHDQEEALTMSDRIAVMSNGVIEQVDTPETVYERPRTTFVAGFIGVSNLMPGEPSIRRAAAAARCGSTPGSRWRPRSTGSLGGSAVTPWCAPRSSMIAPVARRARSRGDRVAQVEGLVESSVYLGTSTQIVVRLPGRCAMTVLCPNTERGGAAQPAGRRGAVRLSWEPEHMHLVRESAIGQDAVPGIGDTEDELPEQTTV